MPKILLVACLTTVLSADSQASVWRYDPVEGPYHVPTPVVGPAQPVRNPCDDNKKIESAIFTLTVMSDPPAPNVRVRPAILNFEFESCRVEDTPYRNILINVAVRRYKSSGSANDYELAIITYHDVGHSTLYLHQNSPRGGMLPIGLLGSFDTAALIDPSEKDLGEVSIQDHTGSLKSYWRRGVQALRGHASMRVMLPLEKGAR